MGRSLYTICAIIALCFLSCSNSSSRDNRQVNEAEQLMQTNADSAMAILDKIDPSYLKVDSIKAKYHYLRAFGHMRQNRSMIGDSLITFAHNFYSGKDMVRDMRSGTAYAWYKF